MNNLEFSFEESPWESLLEGRTVCAARLLTLTEGEEDLEAALEEMEQRGIALDISQLPLGASGEGAVRLRQEMQLVKKGLYPRDLEENDPLRLYLEEVAGTPAFGDEELLARDCAAGDEKTMERLTNLGLSRVLELAQAYVGHGVLLMDLIQEGSLGLWQAVSAYTSGDYAAQRDAAIRFALGKAVTVQALASGIGEKMRRALEDYRSVDERLLSDLGRNPTLEEIALELHVTAEEADSIRKMLEDARSLAQARREPELEEEEEAQEQAVEDTAQFQMRQRILDLLSGLGEQEQKLLTLRFGLEGGKPLTAEETGRKLGLTPQEVTAKEAAALSKLRGQ